MRDARGWALEIVRYEGTRLNGFNHVMGVDLRRRNDRAISKDISCEPAGGKRTGRVSGRGTIDFSCRMKPVSIAIVTAWVSRALCRLDGCSRAARPTLRPRPQAHAVTKLRDR